MRLAIISDVHGNLVALEAVLADIRSRGVDGIVNLGDLVTGPLWPAETWALLQSLAIPTVRGNHDRWLTLPEKSSPSIAFTRTALSEADRQALASLPASVTVGDGILAVHGTPASDEEYLLEDAVDGRLGLAPRAVVASRLGAAAAALVLCGHSHHQHAIAVSDTCLVLNPGSVGFPRYADNAGPLREEAGSPHARYAVATRRPHGWTIENIVLAYDWHRAAERARSNGRPEWARRFMGRA